jgi:hypothetical protein
MKIESTGNGARSPVLMFLVGFVGDGFFVREDLLGDCGFRGALTVVLLSPRRGFSEFSMFVKRKN